MDAKDLRTEAALGGRNNDGNTKYAPSGSALQGTRNKPYQDVGANSLAKVDVQNARPCAVIGPDRVLPPPASYDAYLTKGPPVDLWPADPHRRPPEYPHKVPDYQHPSRNISPRQTFQENMQRILVPPSYNSTKTKENPNFPVDSNVSPMRNIKLNVPAETKYCDVPYSINALNNEQNHLRNVDIGASNINSVHSRSAPHGWPLSSANTRPPKPYGAPELYQYPEYQNCAGPRPVIMTRPHRTVHEDPGHLYSNPYHHEANIRFKPYPTVKERLPQARYEYIGNSSNPFHAPHPFPTHKYDLQKAIPPHQYSGYPQIPLKYLDSRMTDPIMNGYQRPSNPQANFNNVPFRSPVIQPTYGPVPSNIQANKFYPYPSDSSVKVAPNKLLPYDSNNKIYTEYENARNKSFPESFFVNEMTRQHPMKTQLLPPNYSQLSMHTMPTNQYYRKDFPMMKNYEYAPQFRNIDPSMNISVNPLARLPSQFSPSTIALSPSDSNTSIETAHTQGTAQEDYGYASQSSSASIRSTDFGISRVPNDLYRRYEYRYGPLKTSSMWSKSDPNPNTSIDSKDKKDIRQFLQNWSEGEEENGDSKARENISKQVPNSGNKIKHYGSNDQEQLYVLGLVNVSSDELAKYEHIQKVSKLPENIKGYNNIELLTQFEEVIESSKLNNFNVKPSASRDIHFSLKGSMQGMAIPPRPLSPLDVEAKISQSVIHKDVGCNFEIKPCSPKMLNVEIAAPVQTVLGERVIEKVTNQHIINSPTMHIVDENIHNCNVIKRQNNRISLNENPKVPSCKMIKTQCPSNGTIDSVKTNYSLQDFESSSGICLASLPRLDNDIELSFPEVNQQFINANRMEPHTDFAPLKDLPTLDFEQSDEITKNREIDNKQFLSGIELEKDCSKLSKYRKLKKKDSETKDQVRSEPSPQAMRTDSVIIKNPDNIKSQDEKADSSYATNNSVEATQIDPINLTVHSEEPITGFDKFENTKVKPNDFAIDFSLNSNEHYCFKRTVQTTENNIQDTLLYDTKENSPDIKSNDHMFTHLKNVSKFTELQEISPNVSDIVDDPVEVSKSKDNEFNVNEGSHVSNKIRHKNGTTTGLSVAPTIQPVSKNSNNQNSLSTADTKDKKIFEETPSTDTITASCTVPQAQQTNNIQNENSLLRDLHTHLNEQSSKLADADEVIVENKLVCSNVTSNPLKITDISTTFNDISVHSGHEEIREISITKSKNDDQITSSENKSENNLKKLHEIHKIETDGVKRKLNQAPVSVTKKVRHLNKEMFSPWIQKLILNEGKSNIIMNKKKTLETTVLKKTVPEISNIDYLDDNTKNLKTTDIQVLERPDTCDNESMFTKNLSNLRIEKTKNDVIHHMVDYKMSEPISEKLQDDNCVNEKMDINTLNESFSIFLKSNVEELIVDTTIKNESHSEKIQSDPRSDEAYCNLITKQFSEKMKTDPHMEEPVREYSKNEHTCEKSKTLFRSNAILIEKTTKESISENYSCIANTNSVFNQICPEKTQIDNDVNESMFESVANKVVFIPAIDMDSLVSDKINQSSENNNNSHVDETKVKDVAKETIEKIKTIPCVTGTSSDFMICERGSVKFEKSACLAEKNLVNLSNDTVSAELQTEPGNDKKTGLCSDVIVIGNTTSESISKISEDYSCIANSNSVVEKNCSEVKTQIDNCSNETMFKNIAKVVVPISEKGMDSYVCKKMNQFSEKDKNDSYVDETKVEDVGKQTIEIFNTIPCVNSTSGDSKKFETRFCLGEKKIVGSSSDKPPDELLLVIEPGFRKNNFNILESNSNSEEWSGGIKRSDFTKLYKKKFNTPRVDFVAGQLNTNVNKKNGEDSRSESPTGIFKIDILSNEPLNNNPQIKKEEETVTSFDQENNDISKSNDIICVDSSIGNTFSEKQTISVKTIDSGVNESLQVKNTTGSLISETIQNGFTVDSSTDSNITSEKSSNLLIADSSCIQIKIDTVTDMKSTNVDKTTVHIDDLEPKSNNLKKCDYLCNDEDKTKSLNVTCATDYSLTDMNQLNFEMNSSNQECKEVAVKLINNCNSNNIEKVIAQQTSFLDSVCGNCKSAELKLLEEKSNLTFEVADKVSNNDIPNNVEGLAVAALPLSSLVTSGFKSCVCSKLKCLNKKISTSTEESSSVITVESDADNLNIKDMCTIDNLKQDTIKNSQKSFEHYIVKENKKEDENLISNVNLKKSNLFDLSQNNRYVNNTFSIKNRTCLKRSMSDPALHTYIIDSRDSSKQEYSEDSPYSWPNKKKRIVEPEVISETQLLAESYCNIIQHNRRNSISSIHNEQNISFCILIDNDCIITEECNEDDNDDEAEKICFTELAQECLSFVPNDCSNEGESTANEIQDEVNLENSMPCASDCENEGKSIEESWVEDVACVETVVSDDIAEDIVISASTSPRDTDISDNEFNNDDSGVFNVNDYTDRVKYIYGDKMCSDDAQLVETLYRTPQMDVNRTLISRESQGTDEYGHGTRYYDTESLEKVLSESINYEATACKLDAIAFNSSSFHPSDIINSKITEDEKQNHDSVDFQFEIKHILNNVCSNECEKQDACDVKSETINKTVDDTVLLCESSIDGVISYSRQKSPNCTSFSSPEVSSTTYEERNSSILLKITNCGGSMISQVHDINSGNNSNRISCKYTETKDYLSSNNNVPPRPLITKGAQKYIPPLIESTHDLKVKLPLPQHSLIKLKELKVSKEEPKPNRKVNSCKVSNVLHKEPPKKPKPKFEDVLKSIDEVQFKMHKEKKKIKKSIPRVVIKKTENGSHYASTSNNDQFNPDLTGRKWQPWVFLEKNHFIDKMTLMKKTRAIFSHRKKTYVLAEKFQKYKSIGNGKFIISQPKLDESSKGKLKYTIRLKHSY